MKTIVRSLLKRFGYDIVKYNPPFERGKLDEKNLAREYKWLKEYQFKTIIDIGANEGQFSEKVRLLFPNAAIYAFEPLPDVYRKLMDNFSADSNFKAFNFGLGEKEEVVSFFLNEYTPSSSLLSLTEHHTSSFDHAVKTEPVSVRISTLNEILKNEQLKKPLLIKIDVQGYEDKVINGGEEILSKADIIICELSYVELFQGQVLFKDVYKMLQELGFEYSGSTDQLRSTLNNQVLQEDGVFYKKP